MFSISFFLFIIHFLLFIFYSGCLLYIYIYISLLWYCCLHGCVCYVIGFCVYNCDGLHCTLNADEGFMAEIFVSIQFQHQFWTFSFFLSFELQFSQNHESIFTLMYSACSVDRVIHFRWYVRSHDLHGIFLEWFCRGFFSRHIGHLSMVRMQW